MAIVTYISVSIMSKLNQIRWILAVGIILILAFTKAMPEPPGAAEMYRRDSVLYRIHTTRTSLDNILKEYGSDFKDGTGYLKALDEIQTMYLADRRGNQKDGISEAYQQLIDLQRKALLSSPIIISMRSCWLKGRSI